MTFFEYLSGLGLWASQAPRQPEQLRVEPTIAPMRIAPGSAARVAARGNKQPPNLYTTQSYDAKVFKPAKPLPGVLPPDVQPMAMDEALANDWAGDDGLNQWFGEGMHWLGFPYLSELTQRAEYRRITETMARDMTRRWIKIQASGGEDKTDKIKAIEKDFERLGVQEKFRRLAELDGYFGRAHLYIDTGVDRTDRELMKTAIIQDKRTFAKGELKDIRVIEPNWTYPGNYNARDPLAVDFYRPNTWYAFGTEVHRTRLLTMVGREVPDLLKPAYAFGGLSMSQMAKPYVDNWLRTRQSVSDAVHSFSIMVLLSDMTQLMNEGGAEQSELRAQLFNGFRDNMGLFMIDKNREDFKNVSMPLSSLDKLQAQAQEQMASVSGEPLVILTGITPSGLNASSEGELQVWSQTVRACQEHMYRSPLKVLLNLSQLNLFGEIDPEIGFDFEPLKEESAEEEANRRKADAETDTAYINAGVVGADEVRQKVASDEDSPYAGLDLSGPPPAPPQAEPDPLGGGGEGPDDSGGSSKPPIGGGATDPVSTDPVGAAAQGDHIDAIGQHLANKGP